MSEHARRIFATVNATANISTEALESGAVAELVAIASRALYFIPMEQPEYRQLEAALARVREE